MHRGLNRHLLALTTLDLLGVRLIEGGGDGGGGSAGEGDTGGDGGQDRDTGDDDGQDDDTDDDGQGDDDSDDDTGKSGFADLPPKTQAEIRKLRRENKSRRDSDKKFREGLANLLGLDADGKPKQEQSTPADEKLAAENRQLKVDRAAERAIRKAGGDVDAVMDSNAFTGQLADLDPDDDGFADELASIAKKTVGSADRFKAVKPRTGGGASEHGGTSTKGRPKSIRDAYGRRNAKK